ncbi:MAG: MNIO family bufferin maturase [Candidatus Binatia bacterium]
MGYTVPYLGHGVGLRTKHFPQVWDGTARVDWFEVISENFMIRGGRPLAVLERARALAPLVLHGVSLSIGSTDPLNEPYLRDLRTLIQCFAPAWVSDHLCWGSSGGHYAHDLLPLPYTEEALAHVIERVQRVQDRLGRQILIENVSSYLTFAHSIMPEWTFLAEIANRADCGILLDVNNVYVSSVNHGFSPTEYLQGLPVDRIGQVHLAGHSNHGTHLLDTHDGPVIAPVWDLYRLALGRFGRVSTLIEWDDKVPEFDVLCAEAERARTIESAVLDIAYAASA